MLPRPGHYEWVNPTFELACAASAGVDLSATNVSVDPRGLQNLVILAPGRAYRFPRREAGAAALVEAAERLRIAAAAGVPTAQVLAVVEGAVGTAHLVLSPVAGCGLDEIDAGLLPAAAQSRLARELIDVADLIHTIEPADWPGERQPWGQLWWGLVERAVAAGASDAELEAARRAARAADGAPIGVFHGDLGGVNCRIDPVTGRVTGVLDWDSASVGDIGTDSVAILAGVAAPLAGLIRRVAPRWAEDERRYHDYVATWPLQHRLWAGAQAPIGQQIS